MDLIITNNCSKINRVETIPGISDHDIVHVFVEIGTPTLKVKQKPRIIPLYKKDSWDTSKEDMKNVYNAIIDMYKANKHIQNQWNYFNFNLESGIKNHKLYHTKSIRSRITPWISPSLKKLIRE